MTTVFLFGNAPMLRLTRRTFLCLGFEVEWVGLDAEDVGSEYFDDWDVCIRMTGRVTSAAEFLHALSDLVAEDHVRCEAA